MLPLNEPDSIIGKELLGESDMMQDIYVKIRKIAPTDASILILGESGTGKDLVARAIHQLSTRASKQFEKVDIGALTRDLFETELFGHRKGAYTHADEDRMGRFEAADGGTIFLDEIENIPLPLQTKLLSVLQDRRINRVRSRSSELVDVRLICATNISPDQLANEKRFRKDLLYRINTVEIHIPPLRSRGNDIVLLAQHFLKMYRDRYRKADLKFDTGALQKMLSYDYPGNVRELQHMVERAVLMLEGDTIEAKHLAFSFIEFAQLPFELKLSNVERNTILRVIEKHEGNITKAAKELGLTRSALYRRLNKYDL